MKPNYGHIQGPHSHSLGEREYERLQQMILDRTGVVCTIVVKTSTISIRCNDYADYVMAKAIIRQHTSKEIIRSI